jgi:outer membrane lipoprotein carrier protein
MGRAWWAFALVALWLGTRGVFAGLASTGSAQELAQALQKHYDRVTDFSADFVHVYKGGVLRKQLTERGRMSVKKPGKMRWEYSAPERKVFVSDGTTLYFYLPADRQVVVSAVPPPDQGTTPALFLAGQGNLTRDFTASDVPHSPGSASGSRSMKLTPKTRQSEFEWLVLSLDADTLRLRGLESQDAQGGISSFLFTNLKENVGLADRDFTFAIPRGVDVVTDGSR